MVSDDAQAHVPLVALAVVGAGKLGHLVGDVHDGVHVKQAIHVLGDAERYYSEAEMKAQADIASKEQQETLDILAILEGTWVSEDGVQKYVFSENEDGTRWYAEELWFDETEQKWNSWELCVESAFQTPYFGGEYSEDVAEHLQEIVLGNSDHAAADMCVLYDSEENVIRDTDTIYHKQ